MSKEPCSQCEAIEQSPTQDWESVMLGGRITREPIGQRHQVWECPVCGEPWTSITNTGTGAVQWRRSTGS